MQLKFKEKSKKSFLNWPCKHWHLHQRDPNRQVEFQNSNVGLMFQNGPFILALLLCFFPSGLALLVVYNIGRQKIKT